MKPAAAESQHRIPWLLFPTSGAFSATHSCANISDPRTCECLRSRLSPLTDNIRQSSLFHSGMQRFFILSHFLILDVPSRPAARLLFFSSPVRLFHTSVCIFLSAVNCFRSTSATLSCGAPPLPSSKVIQEVLAGHHFRSLGVIFKHQICQVFLFLICA